MLATIYALGRGWTEAALALDEGHFPRELLNELEDLVGELKGLLEEARGGAAPATEPVSDSPLVSS